MVVHGAGRGAKIGFGTANINAIDTLLPAVGVYAGRGFVNNGVWPAAINIGPNPTFGGSELKVEAHLLDWDGSPLYGQPLEIDFLTRLRGVEQFENVEALKAQLVRDIESARRVSREFTKNP
jgi:riboflavin kinase/FMN adenylyltransferase